jgi:DNA-binding GntR family transcriptional regulator
MGMQKSSGLATKAYRKVRESILSGKYLPGEALYEVHLAERYGMSRTPVREALQVLAREGFVDAMPRRGFLVPQWSMQDLHELYELREALEGAATACAAQHATRDEIKRLEKLFDDYAVADQRESLLHLGDEFHNKIIACGHNARLIRVLDSLKAQISMVRESQLHDLLRRRDESIDEHRAILDAIAKGDTELAERSARLHIRSSYKSTMRVYQLGSG